MVVGHRTVGAAGTEVCPRALLCRVERAPYVGELRCRGDLGEPFEHAAGADRGQLRSVADQHQLRAGRLDDAGEPVEAVGVGHAGLIEEDRAVLAQSEPAVFNTGDERVESERGALQGGTVAAEPLRGGPGDGDPACFATVQLLCACGSIDHDALPGAGRPDQDRGTLRPGDPRSGAGLLL